MKNRKLTQATEYQHHPIATGRTLACDTATLDALERTFKHSIRKQENPRMLCLDLQMPITRQDTNKIFRAAQADFVKQQGRHGVPIQYVGYINNQKQPNMIKLALVYDSQKVIDDELENALERTVNRKIDCEYEQAEASHETDSIPLDRLTYDIAFRRASTIAQVAVTPTADRQRVLFSSKG